MVSGLLLVIPAMWGFSYALDYCARAGWEPADALRDWVGLLAAMSMPILTVQAGRFYLAGKYPDSPQRIIPGPERN